jgi:hypothetical protein
VTVTWTSKARFGDVVRFAKMSRGPEGGWADELPVKMGRFSVSTRCYGRVNFQPHIGKLHAQAVPSVTSINV